MKKFFKTILIFITVLLALSFLILWRSPKRDTTPTLMVDTIAPPLKAKLLDGKSWDIEDYQDKVIVISFLASWCPCSNDSAPILKEAYRNYSGKGAAFLTLGMDDELDDFKEFVAKEAFPYPTGFDNGNQIARSYGIKATPTTVVIDRKGIVKRVYYGNIKEDLGRETFFKWIEEVL